MSNVNDFIKFQPFDFTPIIFFGEKQMPVEVTINRLNVLYTLLTNEQIPSAS